MKSSPDQRVAWPLLFETNMPSYSWTPSLPSSLPTALFPPLSGHLTTLSTFPAVLTMHPHTPSPLPKRLPFVVNRLITFVSQQAAQEVSWSVLLSFCFSSIQSQFKGKKRSHQLLKETYSLLWSQFRFFYLSSFRQHFVWCRGWSL